VEKECIIYHKKADVEGGEHNIYIADKNPFKNKGYSPMEENTHILMTTPMTAVVRSLLQI
jgi:hypothetical protein